MLCLAVHHRQAFESSGDALKTAGQKKGALLPISREKPALESIKITQELKVRCAGERADGRVAGPWLCVVFLHCCCCC